MKTLGQIGPRAVGERVNMKPGTDPSLYCDVKNAGTWYITVPYNQGFDPYSFDTVRIRIQNQYFRLNTDPDPIRIEGLDD